MGDIILKKNNVVKRVDSEDKALALEVKGFVRNDGKNTKKSTDNATNEDVINGLKAQLVEAGKVIETADIRRGELEKELSDTKEKLKEASEYAEKADKKIAVLENELAGVREQLEAAVKKNKATDKK